MDIHETISVLTFNNSRAFNEEFREAIYTAVSFLKQMSEKPPLDAMVSSIRYYTNSMEKWGFYTHVPSKKMLNSMTIGELLELAKSGALERDVFSSITSSRHRRLDEGYVLCIYDTLIQNGYATRDELYWRGRA